MLALRTQANRSRKCIRKSEMHIKGPGMSRKTTFSVLCAPPCLLWSLEGKFEQRRRNDFNLAGANIL